MTRYPRESDGCGHDNSWSTSTRPANPNHGTRGWNETTLQIETYDAITGKWYTTVSMLATTFYP